MTDDLTRLDDAFKVFIVTLPHSMQPKDSVEKLKMELAFHRGCVHGATEANNLWLQNMKKGNSK